MRLVYCYYRCGRHLPEEFPFSPGRQLTEMQQQVINNSDDDDDGDGGGNDYHLSYLHPEPGDVTGGSHAPLSTTLRGKN